MKVMKTLKQRLDSPIWVIVGAFLAAGAMPLLHDGDGPANTCVPLTQIGNELEVDQAITFEQIMAIQIDQDLPSK